MFNRIDISKIIIDHLKTLKGVNQTSDGLYIPDFLIFGVVPFLLSLWLTIESMDVSKHSSNLIAAISILGGFLFNLLGLIYAIKDKLQKAAKSDDIKTRFVNEIFTNISFSIVMSIVSLVSLVQYDFLHHRVGVNTYFENVSLFIAHFFLLQFLLSLLLVLNRIYILMK